MSDSAELNQTHTEGEEAQGGLREREDKPPAKSLRVVCVSHPPTTTNYRPHGAIRTFGVI